MRYRDSAQARWRSAWPRPIDQDEVGGCRLRQPRTGSHRLEGPRSRCRLVPPIWRGGRDRPRAPLRSSRSRRAADPASAAAWERRDTSPSRRSWRHDPGTTSSRRRSRPASSGTTRVGTADRHLPCEFAIRNAADLHLPCEFAIRNAADRRRPREVGVPRFAEPLRPRAFSGKRVGSSRRDARHSTLCHREDRNGRPARCFVGCWTGASAIR